MKARVDVEQGHIKQKGYRFVTPAQWRPKKIIDSMEWLRTTHDSWPWTPSPAGLCLIFPPADAGAGKLESVRRKFEQVKGAVGRSRDRDSATVIGFVAGVGWRLKKDDDLQSGESGSASDTFGHRIRSGRASL